MGEKRDGKSDNRRVPRKVTSKGNKWEEVKAEVNMRVKKR